MSTSNLPTFEASDQGPLYCANHPGVETYLRCGKCEKPICAKCRVSTPVGFRCFECARLQVLPTYAISTDYYARAGLAGFAAAIAAGVVMGLFPAFEFWAALLMGIVVPEAVTAAANQKRGPGLAYVAMAAVVFGFVVSRVVMHYFFQFDPLGSFLMGDYGSLFGPFGPLGPLAALGRDPFYVDQYTVIWLALALFLANRRLQ